MKKILSLLTAAVLTSSSVASTTAFTTNTNTKLSIINKTLSNKITSNDTDQQKANAIANKIKNVNISLPVGTNPDTSVQRTINGIKTALIGANPALTEDDLTKMTFSKTTLVIHASTKVTTTITVGSAHAIKTLQVQFTPDAHQRVEYIKNMLQDAHFYIWNEYDWHVSNQKTRDAIMDDIKHDYPALQNNPDVSKISLDKNAKLHYGAYVPVKATINIEGVTDSFTLNIWLRQPDWYRIKLVKEKLNVIFDKHIKISIPKSSNRSIMNSHDAIAKVLKSLNNNLTYDELGNIAFVGKTYTSDFTPGQGSWVLFFMNFRFLTDGTVHHTIYMDA